MNLEKNGIKYVSSPLLQWKVLNHGFLTRAGGVSEGPYASLNFDAREEDTQENVDKNRALFHEAFGVPAGRLVTVNQVHGKEVLIVEGAPPVEPVDADAIITNEKNIAIGMTTADCQPILLFDPANMAIGAVHAGWKGTTNGVVIETARKMADKYGTRPEDLIASLGPCIGPCCYKVGWNVLDEYMAKQKEADCFHEKEGLRMDINCANATQLQRIGLKLENISNNTVCTSCSSDIFFSYRKEGGRTGRQLSFIMLLDDTAL